MSATIALKISNDDNYFYISLHDNGHPSIVRPILTQHYTNINKIKELMKLGTLRHLGPEIGHTLNPGEYKENQCISLYRDVNPVWDIPHFLHTPPFTKINFDNLLNDAIINNSSHFYIFLSEYGQWFYAPIIDGNIKDVLNLLAPLNKRYTMGNNKSLKLKDILTEILNEMPLITKQDKNIMAGNQPLKSMTVEDVDNNIVILRESRKGGFIPEGYTIIYFMDSDESARDISVGKIPYLLIPRGTFNAGGSPITDVWKKKFQKPGHEHILGILEANSMEDNIFLDMLSVRPQYQRNTIASKMIESLKRKFPNAKITHSGPTDKGKAFLKAKGYLDPKYTQS